MCFDEASSLLAWTLSYTIAWYLYNRNQNYDRWNAMFIMCFTTIQLIEAGIWSTYGDPTSSSSINELLTKLVLLVLISQPLFQSYSGYSATGSSMLGLMSVVFLAILMWTIYRLSRAECGQYSTAPGPNGHLVWRDSKSPNFLGSTLISVAYLFGLFVPLLFMREYRGIPLLIVGAITAAYSLMVAGRGEFGSYWCFASVAYAVAALFV